MATGPVPRLVSVASLPQFDTGPAAGQGQVSKPGGRTAAPLGKRFVSNAYTPQIDVGLAAGAAIIFAAALASTSDVQASEYHFGTHAAAIYDGQFRGAIFPAAVASSAPPPTSVAAFVTAAPQAADLTQQAGLSAPVIRQGVLTFQIAGAPQSIDLTQQGWVQVPAAAPLIAPQPAPRPIAAAPQPDPSQPQGLLIAPLSGATPRPGVLTQGAPQADPTQVPAQVFPSVRTPPVIPNPIAGFVATLPQFEERTTQAVLPTQRAGHTPSPIPATNAPPQAIDLTVQGWVLAPLPAPAAIQYPALALIIAAPQLADLTLAAGIVQAQPAPPVVITGPTVAMLPAVPAQPLLDVNASGMWTPSVYSPSAPIPPPAAPVATPTGNGLLPGYVPSMGPRKRPGQVFGEPDPVSPFLTSSANPAMPPPPNLAAAAPPAAAAAPIAVPTVTLAPAPDFTAETAIALLHALEELARGRI